MFCPYCGAQYRDTRGTCQVCGRQAPELPGEVYPALEGTPGAETCPSCGGPLAGDEVFCGECGTRLLAVPVGSSEGHLLSPGAPLHPTGHASSFLAEQKRAAREDVLEDDQALAEAQHRVPSSYVSVSDTDEEEQVSGVLRKRSAAVFALNELEASPEAGARSRMALIIGLLCFLASLISGGAAIWLAVTSFH